MGTAMSTTLVNKCDACSVELSRSLGPRMAHAVVLHAGHGVLHNDEHDSLDEVWSGDLCEDCIGDLTAFARYTLGQQRAKAAEVAS